MNENQAKEEETIVFNLVKESGNDVGSRNSGAKVFEKILKALETSPKISIRCDRLISSGFADEVFGRLFHKLGPTAFMQKINLLNKDPTTEFLIDRAIVQRAQLNETLRKKDRKRITSMTSMLRR